jgi:hypothetical protein
MSSFDEEAKKAFPCEIRWISLTKDASSVNTGSTTPLANEYVSSCTFAFLEAATTTTKTPSWSSLVESMDQTLEKQNDVSSIMTQETLLQSSRLLNVNDSMNVVPVNSVGKRRALLIGIDYATTDLTMEALATCHESILQMQQYLMDSQGFDECQITMLMDKPGHPYYPTRKNILASFQNIVNQSRGGDVAFVHFVGKSIQECVLNALRVERQTHYCPSRSRSTFYKHSTRNTTGRRGQMKDTIHKKNGNRYIDTLLPIDVDKAGPILADEMYQTLLCPMRRGVTLTCLMDCSNGGSVIQLPYKFTAKKNDTGKDDELQRMYRNDGFDVSALVGLAIIAGILVAASGDGGGSGGDISGGGGGGGITGASSAESSEYGDGCCGECCNGLFDGLFE